MYRKLLKYLLFISLLVASACQGDENADTIPVTAIPYMVNKATGEENPPATGDKDEKSATGDENADTTPATVEEKRVEKATVEKETTPVTAMEDID